MMKSRKLPIFIVIFAILGSLGLNAQNHEKIIKDYFFKNKSGTFKKADLLNFTISSVDTSVSPSSQVIKLQQVYDGLPIYG